MTPATPPSETEDIDQRLPPKDVRVVNQKITASFAPLGTVMFRLPLFAVEP